MNIAQRSISVRNPRTGEMDYAFTPPTAEQLESYCKSMHAAQQVWEEKPLSHRAEVLLAWADAIEKNAKEIGDAEFLDTGRYRISHEVPMRVARAIRSWCKRAEPIMAMARLSGSSSVRQGVTFDTQLKPLGLLGVISPWNHPFLLSTMDAVPALIAGCAVIIKPSEVTPRFIEPVMKTVQSVPELATVLRYIAGDGVVGQQLVEHVDAQCFTGSVPTGRKIAEACARRFIPAFLELGGKDAAIVTQNADLDRAATAVTRGSVYGTGQICFAIERVYIHESAHDRFVESLVKKANELELNYPDPRKGTVNPFIFGRQAEIVDAHIDDALAKGAKIVAGGKSETLGGGRYMRPTVMIDVNHQMRIMREETFGPVTPVMKYKTEDEAIELANDTDFGLSGAVIAGDLEEAKRLGRRLNAGAVSLQDAALTESIMQDVEKTSFRYSGLGGSRMGPNSLLRFFRKKALIANQGASVPMYDLGEDLYQD